jgi:hypothetical protein
MIKIFRNSGIESDEEINRPHPWLGGDAQAAHFRRNHMQEERAG